MVTRQVCIEAPAVVLADSSVVAFVNVEVIFLFEEQVVTLVIDVFELRNDVYIVYADVDADVRVATPPEVGRL